jgi:hypothetical protein
MTVHTICDRCGLEYLGPGVSTAAHVFCCAGCAAGTGCICGGTGEAPAAVTGTTVVAGGGAVIAPPGTVVTAPGGAVVSGTGPWRDDVVIVE